MESYTFRFQKYSTAAKRRNEEWNFLPPSLLRGKVPAVYLELCLEDSLSYEAMKGELLKRFQCSEEGFRTKMSVCSPRNGRDHVCFNFLFCLNKIETFTRLLDRVVRYANIRLTLASSTFDKQTFDDFFDLILREQLLNSEVIVIQR